MATRSDWIRIELNPEQLEQARQLGEQRQRTWEHERVGTHGSVTLANNILGAQGEIGFCAHLGKPHPNLHGGYAGELRHGSDAYGWSVRTAREARFGLNLKSWDKGKKLVLVLGHESPVLWIVGWITGADGLRLGVLHEDGEGDREWWRVGQEHLKPWPQPSRHPVPAPAPVVVKVIPDMSGRPRSPKTHCKYPGCGEMAILAGIRCPDHFGVAAARPQL